MKKDSKKFYLLIAFSQLLVGVNPFLKIKEVGFAFSENKLFPLLLLSSASLCIFCFYKYFKLKSSAKN